MIPYHANTSTERYATTKSWFAHTRTRPRPQGLAGLTSGLHDPRRPITKSAVSPDDRSWFAAQASTFATMTTPLSGWAAAGLAGTGERYDMQIQQDSFPLCNLVDRHA